MISGELRSRNDALESSYKLVEDLLRNPGDMELENVHETTQETLGKIARYVDGGTATLLESFVDDLKDVDVDDYVQTFELEPTCPLYLGCYRFKEPSGCVEAANSERNMYMIELINIYKHFGLKLDVAELPDFLPLMIEFLWISLQRREDSVREKFIKEYLMPTLPELDAHLESIGSPYQKLFIALSHIVEVDLEVAKGVEVEDHVVG